MCGAVIRRPCASDLQAAGPCSQGDVTAASLAHASPQKQACPHCPHGVDRAPASMGLRLGDPSFELAAAASPTDGAEAGRTR